LCRSLCLKSLAAGHCQSTAFPSAFRNLGLCFGSLTGRTYFGTVAKLIPKLWLS
jgi:hypothetical protein